MMVSVLFVFCLGGALAIEDEACTPRVSDGVEVSGDVLLQTSRHSSLMGPFDGTSLQQKSAVWEGAGSDVPANLLFKDLPPHLQKLGLELFGSEKAVNELVAGSREDNIMYAGIPVRLRTLDGSLAHGLFRIEAHGYGLEFLRQVSPTGAMQMLDVGGNYGVVAIAAFKLYPEHMRVLTVEPFPSNFFMLRWNMWLNGVPELKELSPDFVPGVLALNHGVGDSKGEASELCYFPPNTMAAFSCNCTDWPLHQCMVMTTISMEDLMGHFGETPITMIKMDCEGCEAYGLPAVTRIVQASPSRVGRLAGELHGPGPELEAMACHFDSGRYISEVCPTAATPKVPIANYGPRQLLCGVGQAPCESMRTSQHAKALYPKYASA